jgi:hypothetical protein
LAFRHLALSPSTGRTVPDGGTKRNAMKYDSLAPMNATAVINMPKQRCRNLAQGLSRAISAATICS